MPIMGYVDKNLDSTDLGAAIKMVSAGQKFYCKTFMDIRSAARNDPEAWTKTLSDAELRI